MISIHKRFYYETHKSWSGYKGAEMVWGLEFWVWSWTLRHCEEEVSRTCGKAISYYLLSTRLLRRSHTQGHDTLLASTSNQLKLPNCHPETKLRDQTSLAFFTFAAHDRKDPDS